MCKVNDGAALFHEDDGVRCRTDFELGRDQCQPMRALLTHPTLQGFLLLQVRS